MTQLRVLVFGQTGSGKTSLCNTLTGQRQPTSSAARGVTFESFNFAPFFDAGSEIILTDTVGLNEGENGTVDAAKAAKELAALILGSHDGYHAVLHVMRIPRITEMHVKNYQFFVEQLLGKKVPCILVATGCENEDPMHNWISANADEFLNQGCQYQKLVATCFGEGGRLESVYAPLREESRKAVLAAIHREARRDAVPLFRSQDDFEYILRRAWNAFCGFLGLEKWRADVNESSYDIMIRLGVPETIAAKMTKIDIAELARKGAWYVVGRILDRRMKV